jgi:hypothetical protein
VFQCNHGCYSALDQFSSILRVFSSLVSNKNLEVIINMISYSMIWVCWKNHRFYAPTVKDEINFNKKNSFLQFIPSVSIAKLSLDLVPSDNSKKPLDQPFQIFIINNIKSISFSTTTSTTTKVKEYDITMQHDQHTYSGMIQVSILRRMHEDMHHPQYGGERCINVLIWFQMQIQISFRQHSSYSLWLKHSSTWYLSFDHHHDNITVNW